MKKLQKIINKTSIFLGLFIIVFLPLHVQAQEYSGTIQVEQTDTDTKNPVQGIKLALYKVADLEADGAYKLTKDFQDADVDPDHLFEKKIYNKNVKKLDEYIEEKKCSAISSKVTGADGIVSYTELSDGIYFIKQNNSAEDFKKLGYSYETDSYLVVLPWMDENENVTRTVNCKPKGKIVYPEDIENLIVYKVWKDDNDKAGKRPVSITVGLYQNGKLFEKVTLNANNNWTYQLKNLSKKENWKIEELAVPSGYTSEITAEGSTYTIINTWTPPSPPSTPPSNPPVKTGDTTNITWYVLMLGGAAVVLAGLWVYRKKNKN